MDYDQDGKIFLSKRWLFVENPPGNEASSRAGKTIMKRAMNAFCRTLNLAIVAGSVALRVDAQTNAPAAETGFEAIFDGKTLNGWDGDPRYWRAENGCLVGEITPETVIRTNTFIIWRGGAPADFELKAEYRISARGNSGINYRSIEEPGQPHVMRGYQADIDGQNRNANGVRYTGQNYEERGRTFLALRGQVARIEEGKKPIVVASLGDPKELEAFIKNDDWNEYHLIASGNVLTHILNGHVMCVVVDEDPKGRRSDGLIGVQIHQGPPMKIEYRNLRLKKLSSTAPVK